MRGARGGEREVAAPPPETSALLGILLVVEGHLGHHDGSQLVFHHPASLSGKAQPQTSNPVLGLRQRLTSQQQPDPLPRDHPVLQEGNEGKGASGKGGGESNQQPGNQAFPTVLGYSPNVLASLLTPKASMCDAVFDLSLEDLRFVCYPVRFPNMRKRSGAPSRNQSLASVSQGGASNASLLFSQCGSSASLAVEGVDAATARAVLRENTQPGVAVPDAVGEDSESCGSDSDADEPELTWSDAQFKFGDQQTQGAESESVLSLLNVVLVVRADHHSAVGACASLAEQLMRALVHEEKRQGYATAQVERLLEIRDHVNRRQVADAGTDPQLLHKLQLRATLGKELMRVYEDFNALGRACIAINNWAPVHSLPFKPLPPRSHPSELRPYHTVLLLQHEDTILAALPHDCNPALRKLVAASANGKGFHTFRDFQLLTGIDTSELFALSCHLVHWGMAMVTQAFSRQNSYVLRPTLPPIGRDSALDLDFCQSFQSPEPLASVLARLFKAPMQVGEFMHNGEFPKHLIAEFVPWLLRNQLVEQLHMFVDHVPSPRASAQQPEVEAQRQFESLLPYFDGNTSVEQIIGDSGKSREAVLWIINRFDDQLVTSLRPAQ